MLNWRPQFTLDSGLDRTIAWYREFLGAPRRSCTRARDNANDVQNSPPAPRRNRVLVQQYYDAALTPQPFMPGESAVPVSGKVFDSTELRASGGSLAGRLAHHRPFCGRVRTRFRGLHGRALRFARELWIVRKPGCAFLPHLSITRRPQAAAPATRSSPWPRDSRPPLIPLFKMAWYRYLSTFNFPPTTSMSRN